ncbi:MAG: DegV family protein [Oscillospiraceae bacterium]|nr:DegV family protein [Oscillospiraceae bacterium]
MIRIMTDSSADLTPEQYASLGVELLPLGITFEDGTPYLDRVDLHPDEFYQKLAACTELPTTSQPAPGTMLAAFEQARDAGDELVLVLLSSELSGTVQTTRLMADELGYEGIHVVDSLNAAMGLQLLVRLAVRLRSEGLTAARIAARLDEEKRRVRLVAMVDTLKYLHKGGRLPGAVAVAGELLGIKPIIAVRGGQVKLATQGRGLPGAYTALCRQIEAEGGIDPEMEYLLGYTADPARYGPIADHVTGALGLPLGGVTHVGPAIGTHIGPGACGVAFFEK